MVYEVLREDLLSIISSSCSYIQTSSDSELINEMHRQLQAAAELPASLESIFENCITRRLVENAAWMESTGDLIVNWIRTNQK